MPDQRGDRDLRETKVIGDAGEAVPQHVGCHIPKRRIGEELLPALRKVPDGVVFTLAGEDIGSIPFQARGLKIVDDRKADWSHGSQLDLPHSGGTLRGPQDPRRSASTLGVKA